MHQPRMKATFVIPSYNSSSYKAQWESICVDSFIEQQHGPEQQMVDNPVPAAQKDSSLDPVEISVEVCRSTAPVEVEVDSQPLNPWISQVCVETARNFVSMVFPAGVAPKDKKRKPELIPQAGWRYKARTKAQWRDKKYNWRRPNFTDRKYTGGPMPHVWIDFLAKQQNQS